MNNNRNNNTEKGGYPEKNIPMYSNISNFPIQGGINNNNFNRSNMPSNMIPPQGWNSGNPNGNFKPQTTNQQMLERERWFNFNKSFTPNKPLIPPIDYSNSGNLLHDNVEIDVLDEHIVEYRIMIDSMDRDINRFTNPFKYTVYFDPTSNKTLTSNNGKLISEPTRFKGQNGPSILRKFRNVKYVKLDNIVLPQHTDIIETSMGWEIDSSSQTINDDRFTILSIKELDNTQTFATNSHSDAFGVIIAGKCFGNNYFKGNPYNSQKYFKNSSLGKIDKLTIEFKDSFGKLYNIDGLDPNITYEDDVRNPLHKSHQNHLSLIIGVVESQINTNTKFEQS